MDTTRIYIVEDEALIVMELVDRLTRLGYQVCGKAARGEQALEDIPRTNPDIVLMDICLAGKLNGIETAAKLRRLLNVPIVFLSAFSDAKLIEEAVGSGAFGYLLKPFEERELHATLQAALAKHRLERTLQEANATLDETVRARTAALTQSEAQLRDLFDGTSDLIQSVAPDGRLLFVNRAWRETLGYSADEVVVLNVFDVIQAECRDHYRGFMQQILAGEKVGWVEILFRTKNGRAVVAEGQVSLRVENGRPVATRGIFRDITERKQAETALRSLNTRLDFLLSSSPATIYTCEAVPPYAATFISANLTGLLGYTVKEFLASPSFWADRIHPEDRDRVFAGLPRLFAHGTHLHEYRFQHKDGSWRWMRDALRVVPGPDGKVGELIGYFIDITEQKASEEIVRALNINLERLVTERTGALRESEERLRTLFEQAAVGVAEINTTTGRFIRINRKYGEIVGYSMEQMLALDFMSITHPDDLASDLAQMERFKRGELREFTLEKRYIRKDGSIVWVELTVSPLRAGNEALTRHIAVVKDITERKQVESQLRLTQFAVEHAADAVLWADDTKRFVYVNEAACRSLGYTRKELLTLRIPDIAPQHDPERFQQRLTSIKQGRSATYESLHRRKDGTEFPVEASIAYLEHEGQGYTCGIVRDITERKRAEEALAEKTNELSDFIEHATVSMHWVGPDGIILWANQTELDLLGYTSEEYIGHHVADFHVDQPTIQDILDRLRCGAAVQEYAARLRSKDGSIKGVLIDSSVLRKNGKFIHTRCFTRDITERKRAEQALRESEERFRILFEQAAAGVAQVDTATGRCARVNRKLCEITGYSQTEMLSLDVQRLTHPDDWEGSRNNIARLTTGEMNEFRMEKRLIHKDGTAIWVKLAVSPMWQPDATPDYLIAVVQDITERKQAEAALQAFQDQIRQMQKMEAIGQLAGGVAHDFNNILTAILGNAEMAAMKTAAHHPAQPNLTRILEAGTRASHLVQQILTFTHQQEFSRTALDLAPVIYEALALLRATLPAGIELTAACKAATPPVLADATQVHQVLMNLCTNAWHALKEQPGQIAVDLAPVTLTQTLRSFQTTLPPGRYARLSIRDSGCGMEPETVERIFDPFFTTKPVGQGTGLGLSVVHGIVRGHEGAIVVDSRPSRGTTVHLYFPAIEAPAQARESAGTTPAQRQGRNRHLLYLDDEEMLVELVRTKFEPLGYRVTGCTTPTEALDAVRADPSGFDVVVTDYNMPTMSGLEVASALARLRADLPVAVVSGYLSPAAQAAILAAGIKEIVYKPTLLQQLGDVIARLTNNQRRT
jgi:PAS domain S-box-containing protein